MASASRVLAARSQRSTAAKKFDFGDWNLSRPVAISVPQTLLSGMDRERRRIIAARRGRAAGAELEALGPVPGRTTVGHSARGLLAFGRVLGLLPPRPRALARVPLGRGRAPRLQ